MRAAIPSSGFPVRRLGFPSQRILFLLILTLCEMVSLTGCATFRTCWGHRGDPLAGLPRSRFSDDPQVEEVVDHLNRNVQKLHAWRANTVRIRANNMPLSGTLAVEEGQHLRLVVHSIAGNEVDMGCNDDLFWIWAKRMEPSYVYCKHSDIDAARQTLGVPFEPQWLMQALGVAPIDTKNLKMKIDPQLGRALLFQTVVTAHGNPMKKVMVVDLNHGVILEHSIYNSANQKVALARLEEFHLDKKTGVVLPRRLKLDWPQNEMSLVMHLEKVEINPTSIPSQIWQMPRAQPGVQMVNLGAEGRKGIQYVERDRDPAVDLMEPEDAATEHSPGRVRMTAEQPNHPDESEAEPPRLSRAGLVDPIQFESEPIHRGQKQSWDED